jgi:excinuclease ABC subunit C
VLNPDREQYEAKLDHTRLFLQGRSDALIKSLRAEMERASEALEFELAAHYRDQLSAIERVLERQTVDLKSRRDIDVFGMHRAGADGAVVVLEIRAGVMIGTQAYPLKGVELDDEDVVEDALASRYSIHPVPDVVVTPVRLKDAPLWAEMLGEGRSRKVSVVHPQRGDKRRLLDLALKNALKHYESRVRSEEDNLATLQQIQRYLGLRNLPARIECYDISNIQGTDSVGSMVVAIDGVLKPKSYRHFKIQGEQTPDDYRMMREVLSRRFRQGAAREDLPDLVLIDGGKGQLAVAVDVLTTLELHEVETAGLAKQRLLDADGHVLRLPKGKGQRPSSEAPERSPERVFRPGRKNPTGLKPNSNGMHLLMRLRDEAHRFAITHHRKRRKKRTIASELDGVEGLGPTRTKALLRHFGSLKRVKAASVEALSECPKIPPHLAEKLYAHLHGTSS